MLAAMCSSAIHHPPSFRPHLSLVVVRKRSILPGLRLRRVQVQRLCVCTASLPHGLHPALPGLQARLQPIAAARLAALLGRCWDGWVVRCGVDCVVQH